MTTILKMATLLLKIARALFSENIVLASKRQLFHATESSWLDQYSSSCVNFFILMNKDYETILQDDWVITQDDEIITQDEKTLL